MTRGAASATVLVLATVVAVVVIGVIAWLQGAGPALRTPVQPAPTPAGATADGGGAPVFEATGGDANARKEPASSALAVEPAEPALPGQVMLTGRLLREDGQPVVEATCSCWLQCGSEYRFVATTCDAAGRFRLAAPSNFDGTGRRLAVSARSRTRLAAPWAFGELPLADSYPPGEVDVGVVTMVEQGFLFAGTVRGSGGAAIQGAAVFAMPSGLDPLEMRNQRLPERFRCETDARGRFEIFGPALHREYSLVARFPGMHQVEPVRSAPGATSLVVDMAPAASVAGSVALAADTDWRHVYLQLSGPATLGHAGSSSSEMLSTMRPLEAGQSLRLVPDAAGGFHADSLRPGLLDVAVHVWGRATPVATVGAVWLEAGKLCEDARLQGISLATLRTVRLTFTEAGDAMARPMVVGVKDSDQTEWSRRVSEPGGSLQVSSATGSFDLLVQQAGVRRLLVADIRGDRTIAIEPGLPVRVVVQVEGGGLPGYEVSFQLVGTEVDRHPEFEHPAVPRSESVVVTDGHEVELRVPGPGRYRAVAHLRRPGGPPDESMVVNTPSLAPLDVASPAATKPWVVQLPAAELQQADRVLRALFGTRAATTPR